MTGCCAETSACAKGAPLSEQDLLARREKIFDAACEVIQADGYSNASVEKLARKACMSKKTIYQTFESKETLLTELMRERLFLPMESCPLPQGASLGEELTALMRQIHAHCIHPRNLALLRLLIGEAERDLFVETTLRELIHLSDRQSFMNAWLLRKKEAGLLKFENLEETAAHLFGLVLGAPFISHLLKCVRQEENSGWTENFIKEGVRVFLAGYGT